MVTTAVKIEVRDPRSYVRRDVWDREIELLMRDNPVDEIMANRLFGAAVSYLVVAMEKWGQGLEHIPEIAFKYDGSVERTAQIIAEAGFDVDWKLWERDYGKCGPCSPGANCH